MRLKTTDLKDWSRYDFSNKKSTLLEQYAFNLDELFLRDNSFTLYSIVRIESNYALNIKKLGACRDEV